MQATLSSAVVILFWKNKKKEKKKKESGLIISTGKLDFSEGRLHFGALWFSSSI